MWQAVYTHMAPQCEGQTLMPQNYFTNTTPSKTLQYTVQVVENTSNPTDLYFWTARRSTQQAGRPKEGKAGRGGGESTRNPTLAGRRARAQSKTRNKAKPTSSETAEAGQQREGTNTLLGEGEEGWERGGKSKEEWKRREKKGGGSSTHGPTWGNGRRTQLYCCMQGRTGGGGKGRNLRPGPWSVGLDQLLRLMETSPLWVLRP